MNEKTKLRAAQVVALVIGITLALGAVILWFASNYIWLAVIMGAVALITFAGLLILRNKRIENATPSHRELAEAHVEQMHSMIRQIVKGNQNLPSAGARTWTSKLAKLSWGGSLGSVFTADFSFDDGTSFTFRGQGAPAGTGVVWGVLTVNIEPSEVKGIPVNFQYNLARTVVNVNFWNSNTGTFVGSFVGGGESFGAAIGGGHGDF